MSTLAANLRRQLEHVVKEARHISEEGARKALEALAVHEPSPYRHMDEAQRKLRVKLRAQAKQLGDGENRVKPGAYEIKHLVEKLAYDQWHRLLFARFLLENNLLISPEHGVSVSLEDCEELAPSLKLKDAWAVAARFAAKELPEIFRADDPAGAVELAVEDRNPLLQLVTNLPAEVFIASDSLGWCYQFWQAERKDEVNASGDKIGADELPAVTQLFTEDYMVDFLLDNTLGAWHAGKVLAASPTLAENAQCEDELRAGVALPGCQWRYLRFVKDPDGKWTPAAGIFDSWPKTAKDLTCLDPCMGSGHFVVAMFERLVALRVVEEKLDQSAAVTAVIGENLFGLEIDSRCTQIGAFNLALAAWRGVGHCTLPAMNLACSGLSPNTKKEDWLKLAGDNDRLRNGMERLYRLFKDAPVLGSLINPRAGGGDLIVAAFHELQPLLEKALAQESEDDNAREMVVAARGIAKAAEILAGKFSLVATNVPYLNFVKQGDVLKAHSESAYHDSRADLATCFVERCVAFSAAAATAALVTPHNWLFLGSYRKLREKLLKHQEWNFAARLGPGAFETISGEVVNVVLVGLSNCAAKIGSTFCGLNAAEELTPSDKANAIRQGDHQNFPQSRQLENPDCRIVLDVVERISLLRKYADSYQGICTGDFPHFGKCFWELGNISGDWKFQQTTVENTSFVDGLFYVFLWEDGVGQFKEFLDLRLGEGAHGAWVRGLEAWGDVGVCISQTGQLNASLYLGQAFDNNAAVIIPKQSEFLPALWAFCSSDKYQKEVRKIDQALKVTNITLLKVPFDLLQWQKVAGEKYPHGLPPPFSSDPTQWLFNGHPKASDQPLHVAAARLLGYHWPRQTGSSFPHCPAVLPDGLAKLAAKDGIICLSATKGEAPAAERLRGVLVEAFGKFDVNGLIASAGPKGSQSETLEEWLRDEFFEQHCTLFHHRPFIWHIWDGHKSGFSALVNYHQLTHSNLEKLTYAYLGDWIRRQQAAVDAGEAGSDARLQAAKQLQARLKLILEGEPPYDIFVRWKLLSKQAIGWHPDINDGVRMNIRPFVEADILRKRVKIKWDKDRGKEPFREKKDYPWFWGWDEQKQDFAGVGTEPDGNRWNDCHYSNDRKKQARGAQKPR